MDTQYTAAMTVHGGIYKTPVAGPKKKEPVAPVDGTKSAEKKE
ncbi:hypothetical protein [Methanoregula sp.]|nr:hypothetical protein [Methanoregula sp.]